MPITTRVITVRFERKPAGIDNPNADIDTALITYERTGTTADGEAFTDEKTRAVALTPQEVTQFRTFLANVKARL